MELPKLSPGKRFTLPRPVGSADSLLLARLAERRRMAGEPDAGPFAPECLTEDYELGLKIASQGGRCRFVRARGADAIVFASPSAVESFMHQAASLRPAAGARQPKAIAIGATTADAMKRSGIPLADVANAPTEKDVCDAVFTALQS